MSDITKPLVFNEQEILSFLYLFRVVTHGEEGLSKVAELLGEDVMSLMKLRIRVHDFLEEMTGKDLNFDGRKFNTGE